jgi:hypothetical protein
MVKKTSKSSKASKPKSSAGSSIRRDILHVILIGLGIGALMTLVGVGLSFAIGVAPLTTLNAQGTPIAAQPLITFPTPVPPTPTPSPVPCTADTWWADLETRFVELTAGYTTFSVQSNVQELAQRQADLRAWTIQLEALNTPPPCADRLKAAVVTVADEFDTLLGGFTTVSTARDRALQTVRVMDGVDRVVRELEALNLDTSAEWATTARDLVEAECPALRWFNAEILGKDYSDGIREVSQASSTRITQLNPTELRDALNRARSLSRSLEIDSPAFPECVGEAVTALRGAFDAYFNGLNSFADNNIAAVNESLILAQNQLATFRSALVALQLDGAGLDE